MVALGDQMAKLRRQLRRRRREPLVFQHLENVSRDLLEQHPDVVRQFVGRNAGIYALYRKGKLYYVGLATGLRGRLRAHVMERISTASCGIGFQFISLKTIIGLYSYKRDGTCRWVPCDLKSPTFGR